MEKECFKGMAHRLKDGNEMDLNETGCDVKWSVCSTYCMFVFIGDSGFHYSRKVVLHPNNYRFHV
jgi:hypothetical protein